MTNEGPVEVAVEITQQDIDHGVRDVHGELGPIALAVMRAAGCSFARVGRRDVWVGGRDRVAFLPQEAQGFQELFYREVRMRPMSFTLHVYRRPI